MLSSKVGMILFGEHSDWAADYGVHRGFCIVTGTDQSIAAVVRPSDRFVVETRLPDSLGRSSERTRQTSCTWQGETLLATAKDETEFFRYCAGVAYQVLTRMKVSGGVDIRITKMDLPLKKGVSSSAAVCILVAKAFDAIYNLRMFPHELMEIAYLGERLTGSQCGRMDQACIYGKTPVLLAFEKSKAVRVEPIFAGGTIYMFFLCSFWIWPGRRTRSRFWPTCRASTLKATSCRRPWARRMKGLHGWPIRRFLPETLSN
jgi:galactokinase